MVVKLKAFAYVTREDRLLVFDHVHAPSAGIQVPAGSIEVGEAPADGALREAMEETGLTQLRLGAFLGEIDRDLSDVGRPDEIHHRYFYHIHCDQATPETWLHDETDPSEPVKSEDDLKFKLYWLSLREPLPALCCGHDVMIQALRAALNL